MTQKNPAIDKIIESSDNSTKIGIEDLSCDEKSLSLVFIKCLTKEYPNDMDLGNQIRKLFNLIKE